MPNRPPIFRPKPPGGYSPEGRPNSNARGYDYKWTKFRKLVLARDYYRCTECGVPVGASGHVDHSPPLTGPDDPGRLDMDRCRTLCVSCHAKKTNAEQR
jgi:5-methylcytosine-specific restriction endonuclease McrA